MIKAGKALWWLTAFLMIYELPARCLAPGCPALISEPSFGQILQRQMADKIILFLGRPGAGKETQSRLLARLLNLPKISGSEIVATAALQFRNRRTRWASVEEKLHELLADSETSPGLVIEGISREPTHMRSVDRILERHRRSIAAVILLDIDDTETERRLSGRLQCSGCRATYQSSAMECAECGPDGALAPRDSDKPEIIGDRLAYYRRNTEWVAQVYSRRGKLITVDATQASDVIHRQIVNELYAKFVRDANPE